MIEQACEEVGTCNTDQLSFKAYFATWLAQTTTLAPFTLPAIAPMLAATAKAAASFCTGGSSGTQCAFKWTGAANDGRFGIGQQMSALGAIQSAMVAIPGEVIAVPVTNSTGGTSVGNAAGGVVNGQNPIEKSLMVTNTDPVQTRDRVAAGFLTVAVLGGVIGGGVFMAFES